MKIKIKAIKRTRQSDISVLCKRVLKNIENNPYFPTLPAEYGELKEALPGYNNALADAKGRDRVKVSMKDDQKANVLRLLTVLADYVTGTSKGDKTMLLSSGFDVTGNIVTEAPELSIEKLEVEAREPGIAITRITKATAAIAFVHEYATESPGANTTWTSEGTSETNYTFRGLSSDKRYWFRVVTIGKNGQRVYSAVVSRVIQ
jgi:hypothetical protein